MSKEGLDGEVQRQAGPERRTTIPGVTISARIITRVPCSYQAVLVLAVEQRPGWGEWVSIFTGFIHQKKRSNDGL